jgi:rod shape-determining protein MreB
MLNNLLGAFSHDIGIDLGTANTLIYVRGQGIVIRESSVVAVNKKSKEILAIGDEAKRMVGRTPAHIVAIRPLVDGVVSDYETTEQMLSYFIEKVHRKTFTIFPRPRVVVGIPYGITEVERRAVEEAAINAGAREVYLVEEPMAAAIGVRMRVQDPQASMIVDIGGGTTEVAVISMGGIVTSRSLKIAGDKMNQDIIDFARDEFNLLLGERTAEEIKISVGSALPIDDPIQASMRGRDLVSGLPKEVKVTDEQIRIALSRSVSQIVTNIKDAIEETPPELVADIMDKGIVITGGGGLLRKLGDLVNQATQTKVYIADDPLSSVVKGTGIILEDIDSLREVLLPSGRN